MMIMMITIMKMTVRRYEEDDGREDQDVRRTWMKDQIMRMVRIGDD